MSVDIVQSQLYSQRFNYSVSDKVLEDEFCLFLVKMCVVTSPHNNILLWKVRKNHQGPVVPSIVSLTSIPYLFTKHTGKFQIVIKVKASHSLIAVGAVGFRVPLYPGHS